MYICVCIFVRVYEFSFFGGLFLSVNHFWWCMSISEYVFVLFLSFCKTTIQKVRPFGILSLCYRFLNPDLLCFGLHFCLAWFDMFGFLTALSVYAFLYIGVCIFVRVYEFSFFGGLFLYKITCIFSKIYKNKLLEWNFNSS